MKSTEPKIRKRARDTIMTPKDEAAFSAALKEKFPGIVFACIPAHERRIDYVPALDYGQCHDVQVWVSEPGWVPEWVQRYSLPSLGETVGNLPKKNFRFRPGRLIYQGLTRDGLGPAVFDQGALAANYDVNDREVRSFIDKVFRLSTKFLTNKFARVDPRTGEVVDHISSHFHWAGHDALRMCRERKDLFVAPGGRDEATGERWLCLAPVDYGAAARLDRDLTPASPPPRRPRR